MLNSLDSTSFHYEVISVLGNEIEKANKIKNDEGYHNDEDNKINRVTALGNNYFLWFSKYILDKNGPNEYKNYYHYGDIEKIKIILAIGDDFIDEMTRYNKTRINIDKLNVLVRSER
jgi:hypothetical protein